MYVNSNADYFAIVGGNYNNTTNAGVWNLNLNNSLTNSNNNIGCSDS